jgi:hypothetical protein
MECVAWLYPYFHFFWHIFYTYFLSKKVGRTKKFFLIQCTLAFLMLALVIALIALVMMAIEYFREVYSLGRVKKDKNK